MDEWTNRYKVTDTTDTNRYKYEQIQTDTNRYEQIRYRQIRTDTIQIKGNNEQMNE